MAEIKKESWAAQSLRNAKDRGTIFIPLNYDYGMNFDGPRGRETRPPHLDEAIVRTKVIRDVE